MDKELEIYDVPVELTVRAIIRTLATSPEDAINQALHPDGTRPMIKHGDKTIAVKLPFTDDAVNENVKCLGDSCLPPYL